jgi:hypothetical protein
MANKSATFLLLLFLFLYVISLAICKALLRANKISPSYLITIIMDDLREEFYTYKTYVILLNVS